MNSERNRAHNRIIAAHRVGALIGINQPEQYDQSSDGPDQNDEELRHHPQNIQHPGRYHVFPRNKADPA